MAITYFPVVANYVGFPQDSVVNGSVTFTPNLDAGQMAIITDANPALGDISAPTQASVVNGVLQDSDSAPVQLLAQSSDLNLSGTLQYTVSMSLSVNETGVTVPSFLFNAQVPRTVSTGAISGGSTALTAAGAAFTSADEGAGITVVGAGESGGNLETTIQTVNSSTSVALAAEATATVSGAVVSIADVLDLITVTPAAPAAVVQALSPTTFGIQLVTAADSAALLGVLTVAPSQITGTNAFTQGFLTEVTDQAQAQTYLGVSGGGGAGVTEVSTFSALPGTGTADVIYYTQDTHLFYIWSGSAYVVTDPPAVTSVAGRTGAVVLTSTDVGLANVNNTADSAKPVSTAQATAIAAAQAAAEAASLPSSDAGTLATAASLAGSSVQPGGALGTPSSGNASNLTGFPTLNQSTTGNAATATKLATARAINGVAFDGSAAITIADPNAVEVVTYSGSLSTARPSGAAAVYWYNFPSTPTNAQSQDIISGTPPGTSTPTASTVTEWDANVNMSANAFIPGVQSTATAGATTTLTVASAQNQVFTGTLTQIVDLPTTGVVAGQSFQVINESSGAVAVAASNGSDIATLSQGQAASFTALAATPTTPTQWQLNFYSIIGFSFGATAFSLVARDGNANITANNFVASSTSTATAGATTTLVVGSTQTQIFTGTLTQTVALPTTSVVAGQAFEIINESTGAINVTSSNGNALITLIQGQSAEFVSLQGTPTTSAHWAVQFLSPAAASTGAFGSTLAERDVNANLTAANVFEGFTTTATAAGLTTLTIASTEIQVFTGTTTQTVKLATASVPAGATYTIINLSTGAVTVESSGANTIAVLPAGSAGVFTALVATPTTAANWSMATPSTLAAGAALVTPTITNPTITGYTESVVASGVVTSSKTISLTSGTLQTATLTASTACTFTMPTAVAGTSFVLLLKQPATTGAGSATFTGVKWPGGTAPTITPTAGEMDILTFVSDGTDWFGSFIQGFTY
jgi:hypothetical protein